MLHLGGDERLIAGSGGLLEHAIEELPSWRAIRGSLERRLLCVIITSRAPNKFNHLIVTVTRLAFRLRKIPFLKQAFVRKESDPRIHQSAFRNPKSAIENSTRRSTNPQSAIRIPQSFLFGALILNLLFFPHTGPFVQMGASTISVVADVIRAVSKPLRKMPVMIIPYPPLFIPIWLTSGRQEPEH